MPEERRVAIVDLERRIGIVEADVKEIMRNKLPDLNTKVGVLIAQMLIVMAALAYLIFS